MVPDLETLPPILEVEDQPLVSRQPQTPPPTNINSPAVLADSNSTHSGADVPKERKEPPTLGPERPFPKIDDHTQFWSTYDRVAGTYDKEFLDAWNKSLDVLLIFAGLFSAINTAFIIESYKGLQQDPIETTNTLLRLFITHRNDNLTLSVEDLNPTSSTSSAVAVNSIFFSSLSFSLTAAFGAVTAKQWLTEYNNIGAVKAMPVQGRERQKKYNGLKTWHLRLIIELLPMLLQISLLLFLIGVVDFLWNLDRKVAVIQLVLTGTGLVVYFVTIVIGIIFPSSPFRTPLSIYLPRYFNKARHGLMTLLSSLVSSDRIENMVVAARNIPWINTMTAALSQLNVIKTMENLRVSAEQGLLGFKQRMGYAAVVDTPDIELADTNHIEWVKEDVEAAEAVVWLLEQAEHPDVTITALDAVTRLPPDLVLDLVQKREGLLERLVEFHKGLLPPRLEGKINMAWMRHWPDRAIVSGMALWHILKVKGFIHNDIKGESVVQENDWAIVFEKTGDPITAAKFYLTWNHLMFFTSYPLFDLYFNFGDHSELSASTNPLPLVVEFMDARQASIGSSFTTSVSPLIIHLDAMIHLVCKGPDIDFNGFEELISQHLGTLSSMLHRQRSSDVVSHIAITVAAVYWRYREDEVWSYPSTLDQKRFESMLIARYHAVNKSKMLVENVALALSVIDISKLTSKIFQTLFSIMHHSFSRAGEPNSTTADPNFPKSLLRLSRHTIDDSEIQIQIAEVLGRCTNGDWVSPLHEVYGRDIIRLIGTLLCSTETYDTTTSSLLNMISNVSDSTQLLHLLQPGQTGLHQFYRAISSQFITYQLSPFWTKILELRVPPDFQGPLEVQITFMASILSKTWRDNARYGSSMAVFFNHMLSGETELHWPAYFISAGIISPDPQESLVGNTALLRYISPDNYSDFLFDTYRGSSGEHRGYILLGESILLLWRKANQYHAKGHLSSDWNDSMFFTSGIVDKMLRYLVYVKEQKYPGIEWGLLKEYFQKASEASERTQQVADGEPEKEQERCLEVEAALKLVDDHLQESDHHNDIPVQENTPSDHTAPPG